MHVIPLVINAVCFAILFPVLTRLVTRKWIGWKETAIAVVIYLVAGLLIDWSGVLSWI